MHFSTIIIDHLHYSGAILPIGLGLLRWSVTSHLTSRAIVCNYLIYVTGYWKTGRIGTLGLGLFHFIGSANGYTWLVCFSIASFADPINSWLRQWDPWGRRHGSEIHPSDGETSLTPFNRIWAYDWHFWDPQLAQTVPMEGLTRLQLPNHPLRITCHQW